jgi:glycosyltransferase involved in cell wall biosynthesis
MKIALVGPGIMSIPPKGWGAVEILIWDYYNELCKLNHEVTIINKIRNNPEEQSKPNTPYCQDLIKEINNGKYDFVHLHYDSLYHILQYLDTKIIGFTSHYPYIDNEPKHINDGFKPILDFMINNNKYINFVLAQKDINFLIEKGADSKYLFLLENGIDSNFFIFKEKGDLMNKTIYLGQINDRKGQHKYCHLQNIDIIGPNSNNTSNDVLNNYKGSWTRNDVYNKLTDYGNLLLLSKGEADPLVVKEALMCGLGVVINATSSKNLLPNDFITIIEDEKIDDLNYIQSKIDENRNKSILMRKEIKKYAEDNFSWNIFIKKYINNL